MIGMLERMLDLRDTSGGKFLAVFMSVVLVLSMTNVFAFAESGNAATAQQGTIEDSADQEAVQSDSGLVSDDSAAAEPVSTSANEATVTFEADNASVSVNGQTLADSLLATAFHEDLAFSVDADAGYEIESITAKSSSNVEVPVATQDGVSVIAAENVDGALVVTVKAVAVMGEDANDGTTPSLNGKNVDPSNASSQKQADVSGIHSVTFMVEDAEYQTQNVEEGETCSEPVTPAIPEGFVAFMGWYRTLQDGSFERFDFSTPITSDIQLTAKFSDKWVVLFENADGKVIATQEVSNKGKATKIDGPVAPEKQLFDAWYLDGAPYDFNTPVTGNMTLKPHFVDTHYVYFVSKGSAVSPLVVPSGTVVSQPATPTRVGYDFRFWSTSEDGSSGAFDFSKPLENDVVLYGIWQGQQVNYTIVYWFEKPNIAGDPGTDVNNYMYNNSETKKVAAGSSVSAEDIRSQLKSINYGYYSHGDTTTVAGNGTTVLNVYFKRTVYDVEFNLDGGTMVFKGVTYNNNKQYSFQAKYEQNIDDLWVSAKNAIFNKSGKGFLNWAGSYATHRLTFTSDLCNRAALVADKSTGSVTFKASWGSTRTVQVNYWLQIADDANKPTDAIYKNGKWYSKDNAYTQKLNLEVNTGLSPKTIDGFGAGSDSGSSDNTYNFYYDRLTYSLSFNSMGGSSVSSVANIRYEASTTSYQPADPTRANYVFKGWYLDADYHKPYDFSTATMPNSNVQLFAKWESSQYAADFFNQKGDPAPVSSQGIAEGEYVKDPGTYIKGQFYEGLGQFEGWYWYLPGTDRLVSYSWETISSRQCLSLCPLEDGRIPGYLQCWQRHWLGADRCQ